MWTIQMASLTRLVLSWRHNCDGQGSLDNFCTPWSRISRGLERVNAGEPSRRGQCHIRKSDAMRRAPLDPVDMLNPGELVSPSTLPIKKSWRSPVSTR